VDLYDVPTRQGFLPWWDKQAWETRAQQFRKERAMGGEESEGGSLTRHVEGGSLTSLGGRGLGTTTTTTTTPPTAPSPTCASTSPSTRASGVNDDVAVGVEGNRERSEERMGRRRGQVLNLLALLVQTYKY